MRFSHIAKANKRPEPGDSERSADDWRRVAAIALAGLFVLGLCATLWAAQAVFIPIVVAVLVSYALQPLRRVFLRVGLPESVAALFTIFITVAVIGGAAYAMRAQANAFIDHLPEVARRVRTVLSHGTGATSAMSHVEQAAHEITGNAATPRPTPISVRQLLWSRTGGLFAFAGQTFVVIVLTYYFLASGDLYKRKLVKIVGTRMCEKRLTVEILNDIEWHVARYLAVRVFISAVVAVATWLAFWKMGMPEPAVWGLAAGVLNVVPYIGPIAITATATIVAFVQFDGLPQALLVGAAATCIGLAEGFGLTPVLMGRAGRMNGAAVFIALTCWGFLWGVWGLLLAVPMTMAVKVICDHIDGLRDVSEMLDE